VSFPGAGNPDAVYIETIAGELLIESERSEQQGACVEVAVVQD
jgi:hypothetical protein